MPRSVSGAWMNNFVFAWIEDKEGQENEEETTGWRCGNVEETTEWRCGYLLSELALSRDAVGGGSTLDPAIFRDQAAGIWAAGGDDLLWGLGDGEGKDMLIEWYPNVHENMNEALL